MYKKERGEKGMKIYQDNELIQQLFVKVIQENNEKSGINIIEYQNHQKQFLDLQLVHSLFQKPLDCRRLP